MAPANVIAYAIAGTVDIDMDADPLGFDAEGRARLPVRHHA